MRRWARRFAWSVAVLLAVLVVVAIAAYAYLQQSLPAHSGEIKLAGMAAPVDVVRDAHAIPHLYAKSWDDAWFALGFVHAQDRLWQMEMNRRIAAGRLAEVVGERGLEVDKFMRTLGMRKVAERNAASLDVATRRVFERRVFERYAAGVNAFLQQRSAPLPPEFVLLGVEPEPWTVVDSVSWGKMMQWDLSGNWRSELYRLRLAERLKPHQIAELLAPYPGDGYQVLPELGKLYAELSPVAEKLANVLPPQPDHAVGSNNWVVAGARTTTGKPLLANDPHLGLSAPAIWYFAHLSVEGENIIGATFPGVPAVALGRNDRIAWGVTNTGPDVQDLFIERIDPSDPARYQTPTGMQPFVLREEVIKVKDAAPVTLKVRETRHGPVISDVVAKPGTAMPAGHVLSFQWTAFRSEDRLATAVNRMQHATSWTTFHAAARDFGSPQQNFVYADVDGNIGFIAPGEVPVRHRDNALQGLAPAPGWDARYDWQGVIPFEALPQSFNPQRGLVVTANHKITPREYSHHLTHEWATPHRADRIESLLARTPQHTVASFAAAQGDVTSLATTQLLPLLLKPAAASERAQAWHARLARWPATMTADAAEPLVYWAWMRELTRLTYADELGPVLFRDGWESRVTFMTGVLTAATGADGTSLSRWCDDVTTALAETCDANIAKALELGLADLDKRFGKDESRWRWGAAHPSWSEHRPLGGVPWLGDIANIRVPTPGDGFTVNAAAIRLGNAAQPFANRHAASLRAIYDLSDPERSVFIHSTGQSGNFLSPWYRHFAEPWARNESVPMITRRAEVEKTAIGTLKLVP